MKSIKRLIEFVEAMGVEEGRINGASFGDSGTYLFFAREDGQIVKYKLSSIGISYVKPEDIEKFLKVVYFPAIGKKMDFSRFGPPKEIINENEDIDL